MGHNEYDRKREGTVDKNGTQRLVDQLKSSVPQKDGDIYTLLITTEVDLDKFTNQESINWNKLVFVRKNVLNHYIIKYRIRDGYTEEDVVLPKAKK